MRVNRKISRKSLRSRRRVCVHRQRVDTSNGEKVKNGKPAGWIDWNMISSLISVVMAVITFLTLLEMKSDRDAAYRPDLSFADTTMAIVWDDDGKPTDPKPEKAEYIVGYAGGEDRINAAVPLHLYNIGVGTAKDVTLRWNQEENLEAFRSCFDTCGGIEMDTCDTCGEVFGTVHGLPPEIIRYDFMLNSADVCNTIYFPELYLDLLTCYAGQASLSSSCPVLSLTAEYSDVQGTKYTQKITVTFELIVGGRGTENYSVWNLHFTEV